MGSSMIVKYFDINLYLKKIILIEYEQDQVCFT